MNKMTVDRILQQRRRGAIVATTVLGVIGGAAVSLFAFYLARYGPSGGNWSFRGDGALAANSLVPVLLTAGWCAAPVLHARGSRAWVGIGVAAGMIGLVLAAADAALLPMFGARADARFDGPLLITLVFWTIAAPLHAALIQLNASRRSIQAVDVAVSDSRRSVWLSGAFLAGLAFPPGS